MEKGILINGTVIVAILVAVFLSQQPYFKGVSKTFNFPLSKKSNGFYDNSYISKVNDWLKTNVYSKVSGEVADREAIAKSQLADQKDAVIKNSVSGTKKFIAEKVLQTLGVQAQDLVDPAQCPVNP